MKLFEPCHFVVEKSTTIIESFAIGKTFLGAGTTGSKVLHPPKPVAVSVRIGTSERDANTKVLIVTQNIVSMSGRVHPATHCRTGRLWRLIRVFANGRSPVTCLIRPLTWTITRVRIDMIVEILLMHCIRVCLSGPVKVVATYKRI